MKMNRTAKSLAVTAQFVILVAAPGLTRTQSPAPNVQTAASAPTQADPYAEAFRGLTYSEKEQEAISKIRQEMESRKAIVLKSDKLTQDQKDAMLAGYTRMQYALIYKELTEKQKKLVSTRIHALAETTQAQQKPQAPKK